MKKYLGRLFGLVPVTALAVLAACGGGGDSPPPPATYTVGGTLSGMATSKYIILQNNGGNDINLVGNGSFTFTNPLTTGSSYNVTVLTQPVGQTCVVANGSGTVGGNNVTNVSVTCNNNASSNWGELIWGVDNWA
jgi:hypothetical protein